MKTVVGMKDEEIGKGDLGMTDSKFEVVARWI